MQTYAAVLWDSIWMQSFPTWAADVVTVRPAARVERSVGLSEELAAAFIAAFACSTLMKACMHAQSCINASLLRLCTLASFCRALYGTTRSSSTEHSTAGRQSF